MDVAGLLHREIALVHRAEPLGAEAHLLFDRYLFEEFDGAPLGLVEERGIDPGVLQDREADLRESLPQRSHEPRISHVAGADAVLLVERFLPALRQAIALALLDLLVAREVLVDRTDSAVLLVGHPFVLATSIDACRTRRRMLRRA